MFGQSFPLFLCLATVVRLTASIVTIRILMICRILQSQRNCWNLADSLQVKVLLVFCLVVVVIKTGRCLILENFFRSLNELKKKQILLLSYAKDIVNAGVDVASVEVVGSDDTIQEIFDFNATVNSYADTLQNLEAAGMPHIVPHVCIGLHYGELKGEFHALEMVKNFCDPSLLVLIIFRPTKGTILEHCKISSAEDVGIIVGKAKEMFPNKDISLGCIRPRAKLREEIELAALKAGATRMEIPSKNTIQFAKEMGFTIKTIHACCALPEEFESAEI